MEWIVPSFAFTPKVMKLIHEVTHHIGEKEKKTPTLKEGVPSQSFVIFYLLFLHHTCTDGLQVVSLHPKTIRMQIFGSVLNQQHLRPFCRRKLLF